MECTPFSRQLRWPILDLLVDTPVQLEDPSGRTPPDNATDRCATCPRPLPDGRGGWHDDESLQAFGPGPTPGQKGKRHKPAAFGGNVPELDRVAWFAPEAARRAVNPAQATLIDLLLEALRQMTASEAADDEPVDDGPRRDGPAADEPAGDGPG